MLAAMAVAIGLIAITHGADQPASKSQPAKPTASESPKQATEGPSSATVQTAVERALDAPAEFDFVDTPYIDAAKRIAESSKINVLLDQKNLTDAGVTGCTLFNTSISGVSLRSALHLMLPQNDFAFVTVSDNAIVITTADAAKRMTTPRVYVVRDLIAPERSQNDFAKPTPAPADNLIELITSTLSPKDWDPNGGTGSIAYLNGALVISQTEEIHRKIAALLADLRAVRDKQAKHEIGNSIDLRSSVGQAEQRIRKALDTPLDCDFVAAPLKDIVDSLHIKLGVPIELDFKSLTDAGITPATTISFAVKQVRARDGLHQLLAEKELAFVIEDESLVITTADRAKQIVHPVVYGVGDLCGFYNPASIGGPDYESLIETLTGIIAPMSWDINGGAGSVDALPTANAIVCDQTEEIHDKIWQLLAQLRTSGCRLWQPFEIVENSMVVRIYKFEPAAPNAPRDEQGSRKLIELIRQNIEPKSWLNGDASIGEAPGAIVVRQTSLVQYRIEQFLQIFGATPYPPPPPRAGGLTSFAPPAEARRSKAPNTHAAGPTSVGPVPAGSKP